MVGAFFFIQSEELKHFGFLADLVPETKAEKYGAFLNGSMGHAELFESRFPATKIEYYTFPRGRVVFDLRSGYHVLYADKCIADKAQEIAALFQLQKYKLAQDEHYVCDTCGRG